MKAQDLMTRAVVTVRPDTPAKQAARLLAEHGFTTLPVVDRGDRLVGVVAEADLLRDRVPADPRALVHVDPPDSVVPAGAAVAEVMTTDVVTAAPRTHAAALGKVMLDRHLRTVPIVDGDRLVGVVSRRDLLRAIARDDAVIAADVRHHLVASGRVRWQVDVSDGRVTLTGEGAGDLERHIATVVTGAIAGVVGVVVVDESRPV